MRRTGALLLLLCANGGGVVAQAAVSVQSTLLAMPLPDGTTSGSNFLYRAAVRASMQLDAKKLGMTVGDRIEMFRLPMSGPSRAELFAAIEGAGWRITVDSATPTSGTAAKAGARVRVAFQYTPREHWLYVAPVGVRSAQSAVASVATAPPQLPPAGEPRPAVPPVVAREAMGTSSSPAAARPERATPVSSGSRGFAFTSQVFDDDWNAVANADHVFVRKGEVTCFLFYRVPVTEQMRPPVTGVAEYFWTRDVEPRYVVTSVDRRRQDLQYSQTEYIEGAATDRTTGQAVYIGMNVNRDAGGALNIVIVAPDQATYRRLYPQPDDLEKMLAYNKFAVAASDLVGHWDETASGMSQMYYVNTGNYAGMNLNTANSQFFIESTGAYTSKHVGASGAVGSARVYSTRYAGHYAMSGNWQVTFTNRYGGASETFAAQFEAVQGGRILHLTNVAASGIRYHLARVP